MALEAGVLTLASGEAISVVYSLSEVAEPDGIRIFGSIEGADVATGYKLRGVAVLTLYDGRHLKIIFNHPPQFIGAGRYS